MKCLECISKIAGKWSASMQFLWNEICLMGGWRGTTSRWCDAAACSSSGFAQQKWRACVKIMQFVRPLTAGEIWQMTPSIAWRGKKRESPLKVSWIHFYFLRKEPSANVKWQWMKFFFYVVSNIYCIYFAWRFKNQSRIDPSKLSNQRRLKNWENVNKQINSGRRSHAPSKVWGRVTVTYSLFSVFLGKQRAWKTLCFLRIFSLKDFFWNLGVFHII